jgi:hypothetical protein
LGGYCVEEDVGVDEGHLAAAFVEGFTGSVFAAGEVRVPAGDFLKEGFQLVRGPFRGGFRGCQGLEVLFYE